MCTHYEFADFVFCFDVFDQFFLTETACIPDV